MPAEIINGIKVAEKILSATAKKISRLKQKPLLSSVCVGDEHGTSSYILNQSRACAQVGIGYRNIDLPSNITEAELIKQLTALNKDDSVCGIIVHHPLPEHINPNVIRSAIKISKDVEGSNPQVLGLLFYGSKTIPCGAAAVLECLRSYDIALKGKNVVIVGNGEIIGKPLAMALLSIFPETPIVTLCAKETKTLKSITSQADILIVEAACEGLITKDMLKEGVAVIDAGVNKVGLKDDRGQIIIDPKTAKPKTKLVGSVVFDDALEVAGYITPVPNGLGPVMTAILLRNTVNLFIKQI